MLLLLFKRNENQKSMMDCNSHRFNLKRKKKLLTLFLNEPWHEIWSAQTDENEYYFISTTL